MRNYDQTKLFCLNCGQESFPVYRSNGRKKEKHHRKKLYCWHCKQTVNHIECRTEEEIKEFKETFAAGEFKEEAIKSLEEVQSTCLPCI